MVSFHFGIPAPERVAALRAAGAVLLASATNLAEARAAETAGMDAVVAQGYEAGGHRGVFDPTAPDERLGTLALTRLLVRRLSVPVIAAGGIMDGAGIAAVLRLGAVAAQLGTAFVACQESSASPASHAASRAGWGSAGAWTNTLTLNGRAVARRTAAIISRASTASVAPTLMAPSAPALDTAAASAGVDTPAIGA